MSKTAATAPAPVTARRYNESMSMFVDLPLRAYLLGWTVPADGQPRGSAPGISEVIRAVLDAEVARFKATDPERYEAIMSAGYAEIERREAAKQQ